MPSRLPALALLVSLQAVAQPARIDPDTGAATWETRAHGVALSLTQLLPDQVQAFYLNRGFSPAAAQRYAAACVFMTVLRNEAAPGELAFHLADWRLRRNGQDSPLPALESWLARWRDMGVGEPAQIAFRWAQFPPQQEYAVGEWNQGMLAVGLPAAAAFDLTARWESAGRVYEGTLHDVRCAR